MLFSSKIRGIFLQEKYTFRLSDDYLAQRNPMFVFKFEGELFRLSAKTPALDVLFQFPPRRNANLFVRLYPFEID